MTIDEAYHEGFARALSDALEKWDWKVQMQPVVGSTRPDLVLNDPEGETYIVEVKTGPNASHFGSVAQVAAFRRAAEDSLGGSIKAYLVLPEAADAQLQSIGEDFDVQVVANEAADATEAAQDFATKLLGPADLRPG
jgi:hypothetical protein